MLLYARRRLSWYDAADAVQETALWMYRAAPFGSMTFPRSRFEKWFMITLKQKILEAWKARGRGSVRLDFNSELLELMEPGAPEAEPDLFEYERGVLARLCAAKGNSAAAIPAPPPKSKRPARELLNRPGDNSTTPRLNKTIYRRVYTQNRRLRAMIEAEAIERRERKRLRESAVP